MCIKFENYDYFKIKFNQRFNRLLNTNILKTPFCYIDRNPIAGLVVDTATVANKLIEHDE